jgi:RNA polymerase sigma-70 factor (ECF subfamily)
MRGPADAARIVNDVVASDDVVRRAQQGDVSAFENLYRAHSAAVFALCRRMTGDDVQARELVQDVFVRAWERLAGFRGESALSTWLHRLAVNVVLAHLRATSRHPMSELPDDAPSPTTSLAIDDRLDLDSALARLPAGARVVFVLHDLHGYSHDEIAQMTGIAPGTARAQLWRARRALLQALDP